MVKKRLRLSAFDIINNLFLILLTSLFIFPFLYVVSGSVTTEYSYLRHGITLIPKAVTLNHYRLLLSGRSLIVSGLLVSVYITVLGTLLNLIVTGAMAYPLSKKYLPGRNFFTSVVIITMLFSGGLIPSYLLVRSLGMLNSLWSLMIPFLVNAFFMLIMRNYFMALPEDLEESARLDGASDIYIFVRLILPLSKAIFATIGLFYAVGHWNQWFFAMIYIDNTRLYPLQLVLRGILSRATSFADPSEMAMFSQTSTIPQPVILQMAALVISIVPIALVYPFLQKHFVKGIFIGSLKG